MNDTRELLLRLAQVVADDTENFRYRERAEAIIADLKAQPSDGGVRLSVGAGGPGDSYIVPDKTDDGAAMTVGTGQPLGNGNWLVMTREVGSDRCSISLGIGLDNFTIADRLDADVGEALMTAIGLAVNGEAR